MIISTTKLSKLKSIHYAYFSTLLVLGTKDAEVLRNRTHLFLENKKQSMFISKNNLESMRVS